MKKPNVRYFSKKAPIRKGQKAFSDGADPAVDPAKDNGNDGLKEVLDKLNDIEARLSAVEGKNDAAPEADPIDTKEQSKKFSQDDPDGNVAATGEDIVAPEADPIDAPISVPEDYTAVPEVEVVSRFSAKRSGPEAGSVKLPIMGSLDMSVLD